MNQCDCVTNKDDQVAQALDDFWKVLEDYRFSYHNETELKCFRQRSLFFGAYEALLRAKSPGDPRKEWVDAERIKPNEIVQHTVMVKVTDGEVGLGKWTPGRNENGVKNSWQIQLFYGPYYWTERGVTHWRYIPEDGNGESD